MDFNYWLTKVVYSLVIFIVAKLAHWFFNRSIQRIDAYAESKGLSSLDISDSTKKAISQFSKYIIYIIAFLGVLYVFELNDLLMGLVTAAGVSGIAIGFAAKDLISNALSGIILVFDRPFKIGDIIEIGRWIEKGRVVEIGLRNTVLKLRDGRMITVPNSKILTDHVVNHTTNPVKLVELIVEIDIDSKVQRALELIDKLISKLTWKDNEVGAWTYINDVDEDNVSIKVKVWTGERMLGKRKTELFYAIKDLLKRNQIKSKVLKKR